MNFGWILILEGEHYTIYRRGKDIKVVRDASGDIKYYKGNAFENALIKALVKYKDALGELVSRCDDRGIDTCSASNLLYPQNKGH